MIRKLSRHLQVVSLEVQELIDSSNVQVTAHLLDR